MEAELELFTIFWTALAIALTGAMMPGPLLTVAINESARRGQRAANMLIVGHSMLELVLVAGLTLGIFTVLSNPIATRLIGIVGGFFLLWMGYGISSDVYKGQVSLDLRPSDGQTKVGSVFQGITTSIANPYWSFWWATIGAKYVLDSLKHGIPGLASFYFGHIFGDFLWYGLVAYAVVTGKRFITDRIYRGILFICGLFLVFLSITFIFNLKIF